MGAPGSQSCALALKEWATVLEAMGRGEQLVLIRKGGLIESGNGFELQGDTFLFYPTFEHQAVNYLREPYRRYFEEAAARRASAGRIRIDSYGVAVFSRRIRDPSLIERLSPFHIYNQAFVSQRLKWQPEQPLVLVAIRAFRFAHPHLVTAVPRYAGCKSWVDLEAPVSLDAAVPALDEAAFAKRVQDLNVLLA